MISARIVADSISEAGKRITTFELEYPRFIHSEFMTHRMISKNSASSRAIPLRTMIRNIWNNIATPVHWGQNIAGMQAKDELPPVRKWLTQKLWSLYGKIACIGAIPFLWLGVHKQISNRILEPWSHIKVVATATDWDNFFYLRNHPDAQPEIHELARQMYELYSTNTPVILKQGEWHLPYVTGVSYPKFGPDHTSVYKIVVTPFEAFHITLEDAKKLSASLCAQVSYRKSNESIQKAIEIYDKLVTSVPAHLSPFEHQATPAKKNTDRSGNFNGWRQLRQDIPNNVCKDYKPARKEFPANIMISL